MAGWVICKFSDLMNAVDYLSTRRALKHRFTEISNKIKRLKTEEIVQRLLETYFMIYQKHHKEKKDFFPLFLFVYFYSDVTGYEYIRNVNKLNCFI